MLKAHDRIEKWADTTAIPPISWYLTSLIGQLATGDDLVLAHYVKVLSGYLKRRVESQSYLKLLPCLIFFTQSLEQNAQVVMSVCVTSFKGDRMAQVLLRDIHITKLKLSPSQGTPNARILSIKGGSSVEGPNSLPILLILDEKQA